MVSVERWSAPAPLYDDQSAPLSRRSPWRQGRSRPHLSDLDHLLIRDAYLRDYRVGVNLNAKPMQELRCIPASLLDVDDIKGKHWEIKLTDNVIPELGVGYMGKPFQKPHPPIALSSMA
jgi:hypothetical protein